MPENIVIYTTTAVTRPVIPSESVGIMIKRLLRTPEHITSLIVRSILHLSGMTGPGIAQTESPSRMQGTEQDLESAVVKSPAYQPEHSVGTTQAVTVSETAQLSVYLRHIRLSKHSHPQFPLEIIIHPDIVVASEKIHLDSTVREPWYVRVG